jgi:CxxC motif-containing protein (DUF1111 family)
MRKFLSVSIFIAALLVAGAAFAQTDPGVQGGNRGSGLPLASVNSGDGSLQFFQNGLSRFQDVESVANSPNGNNGLGPRFNFNQCAGCHVTPAVGGTGPINNPQFAGIGSCTLTPTGNEGPGGVSQVATEVAAGQPTAPQVGTVACNNNSTNPNATPFFITQHGPTREARFPFFFNADGSVNTNNPNGGVEDLFTVSGRQDGATQKGCSIAQPSFNAANAVNNIIFRIPTPVFGAGLIENLDDSTLLKNRLNNLNNNFGIAGTFNRNGNDGTITRFGWKEQNKSMELFAGEAYNVEMGISNEIFQQDRPLPGEDGADGGNGTGLPATCLNLTGNGYPEDGTNFTATPGADQFATNASIPSDVVQFAMFMRLLAAPGTGSVTGATATSIANGKSLFSAIGCATCHNPTPGTTQASNLTSSLGNAPVNAFSDIELHHMGTGLADNVSQGAAGGDQFRTAPLWGVGQRIFLLHDGRTTSLITAINQHDSNGSEADIVTDNFQSLTASQQQDVLNFLRSL